jgi:hypothetical protein
MIQCDVREATHVKIDGKIKKIIAKYGIDKGSGVFAKPSEGGFGVITEDSSTITMWEADSYYKDVTDEDQIGI